MTAWKRWSWRYRVGIVFALMMLLQGATCPIGDNTPTFSISGVGPVYADSEYDDATGRWGYVIKRIVPGTGRYERVYPGDPRYVIIQTFFGTNPSLPPSQTDRSSVPGGAGGLPAPPAQ
jgi:hypothetical protein